MVAQNDKRKNTVVLSLGGNIGDVKSVFITVINNLSDKLGEIVLTSSLYKTKAWGVENQPDFLNQLIVLKTSLSPNQVLKTCLTLELTIGRVRKEKWGERKIDIDVLFYNDIICESPVLTLPHPQVQNRNFILTPLVEILPNYKHPKLNKTMQELLIICTDKLPIIKL